MSDQADIFNDFFTKNSLLDKHFKVPKVILNKRIVKVEKYENLYHKVNAMLAQLEAIGIHKTDPIVEDLYNALHEIDGGVYSGKV